MGSLVIESNIPGVIAGTLIAAIVAYAIFAYLKPLRGQQSGIGPAFAALVALWVVKTAALHWFHGFYFDVDQVRTWALRIATVGPAHFYGPGYASNMTYLPGYIYLLWPFGSLGRALDLSWENLRILIETPPLLADLLLGTTIFAYLRRSRKSLKIAWAGMLFVSLNPALLFDTVAWGQSDSVVTSLMWLATLVALDSEYVTAAAVLAIAVLVKPHALIVIPLLVCWIIRKDGITRLWAPAGAFATIVVVAITPFAVGRPWDWLPRFYITDLASMPETSRNAFNLMAIVGGLRQPETAAFYGVSYFTLGMVLALAVLALSCERVWRNPSSNSLMLSVFLALFGEFLFAPRMAERYLYPALVFFAPLALEGLFWCSTFVLLSLNCLFNIAYVLKTLETTFWLDKHDAPAMLSGALNLVLFGAVVSRITTLELDAGSSGTQRPTLPIPKSSRLKLCCNAPKIWGRFSRPARKLALSYNARVRSLGLSADERALVAMVLIVKASLFIFVGFAYQIVNGQTLATAWAYLEIWNRWDGPHYLDIAQRGYQASGADRVLLVFYPLYPWTIRAFATIFRNTLVSALAVSTVASLAAAVELYWLAILDDTPRLARAAVWFLFIFPTSYFLHTDYSESLFLALILGAFLAARDDHWMTAGTLGMLAGLAHPNGALLFPALGADVLSRFWRQRRFKIRWLWIGLIPLAPLIYIIINYYVTGDPRAFMGIEREHWFHFVVPPWRGIADNLNVALTYGPYEAQIIGVQVLFFIAAAFLATIFCAWMLPVSYTVWMAANLLLFTSTSWDLSAPRYVLAMFPMFILIARLARYRYWNTAITVWSLLWLGTLTTQFVVGHWTF